SRPIWTIREITDKGGKVILLSHFGRPKGPDPAQSLKLLTPAIAAVLKRPVAFAEDCIGERAAAAMNRHEAGRHPVPGEHPVPPQRGAQRSRFRRAAARTAAAHRPGVRSRWRRWPRCRSGGCGRRAAPPDLSLVSLPICRAIVLLLSRGYSALSSRAISMVRFLPSSPVDDDCTKVVDVGECRPGDGEIIKRRKEAMAVIFGQPDFGRDLALGRATQRVGLQYRAH